MWRGCVRTPRSRRWRGWRLRALRLPGAARLLRLRAVVRRAEHAHRGVAVMREVAVDADPAVAHRVEAAQRIPYGQGLPFTRRYLALRSEIAAWRAFTATRCDLPEDSNGSTECTKCAASSSAHAVAQRKNRVVPGKVHFGAVRPRRTAPRAARPAASEGLHEHREVLLPLPAAAAWSAAMAF